MRHHQTRRDLKLSRENDWERLIITDDKGKKSSVWHPRSKKREETSWISLLLRIEKSWKTSQPPDLMNFHEAKYFSVFRLYSIATQQGLLKVNNVTAVNRKNLLSEQHENPLKLEFNFQICCHPRKWNFHAALSPIESRILMQFDQSSLIQNLENPAILEA